MAEQYTFTNTSGLIKEGEYEVILEKAEIKKLLSGKEKIGIQFRIRTDVEQEGKNRIIFEDIWKEKDNPQFFNRRRLNLLLATQKIENGKTFDTIAELLKFLTGSMLVVKVAVEHDEYRNEEVNKIVYYRSSKAKPQEVAKPKIAKDEDLPF
jgi:hypothetical protein